MKKQVFSMAWNYVGDDDIMSPSAEVGMNDDDSFEFETFKAEEISDATMIPKKLMNQDGTLKDSLPNSKNQNPVNKTAPK